MMHKFSGLIQFRIDPLLSVNLRRTLDIILQPFKDSVWLESLGGPIDDKKLTVEFVSESSLHLLKGSEAFRICLLDQNQGLFSFSQNINEALVDAVLDETLDLDQLERLVSVKLSELIHFKEKEFLTIGYKNLKKFELKVRSVIGKKGQSSISSDLLLNYFQSLVDLEKELIQADDFLKFEKVLKIFVKNNIEKGKFQLISSSELATVPNSVNILPLPKFKGDFIAVELQWDEDDAFKLTKRLFFYYTLINFLNSQREILDPFRDENLWEAILDAIPFPVALLGSEGEVHQHNTLFAKLGFTTKQCLNLKPREKILINDIPYNIFRKDVQHLAEKKVLFVFFTESFFLKGDGHLTPSGQELGIISSSIAHELNNPIAGIQAALSLMQLDAQLVPEAQQTLAEMKSGANRCKQLIETFLGFSRVTPTKLELQTHTLGPIDICYQQAQNLLRFRTVESGIRFNFESIKHNDFRAEINPSLLTMTFYLILSELMTLYSHQLLVADKNQIEKVIRGEIIESSQEIQIQLHELNISNLSLSKLIQNLLTIEKFVLQVSDYSLRFIYSY
jgi:hypothetical protein